MLGSTNFFSCIDQDHTARIYTNVHVHLTAPYSDNVDGNEMNHIPEFLR